MVHVMSLIFVVCFQVTAPAAEHVPKEPSHAELETRYFQFYSHFWINLHHYLFQEAAYVHHKKVTADADRIARFFRQSDRETTKEENAVILAALAFYERELIKLNLTFNARLHGIKTALTQTDPDEPTPLADLEPELGDVLSSAAPVFKKHLWEKQHQSNRQWIADQRKLVEEISEEMVTGLSNWYGVAWPKEKIRIDLSGSYTHWAGAYTTINPSHVVISSTRKGYRGLQGLEMIFHECSHIPLNHKTGPIPETIAEKCAEHGVAVPRNLWHAILFYTSGELTRRVLEKRGITHELYMHRNDVFKKFHGALAEHWQPFMDGEYDLDRAIDGIISKEKRSQ